MEMDLKKLNLMIIILNSLYCYKLIKGIIYPSVYKLDPLIVELLVSPKYELYIFF
jgi:hypothetical protein